MKRLSSADEEAQILLLQRLTAENLPVVVDGEVAWQGEEKSSSSKKSSSASSSPSCDWEVSPHALSRLAGKQDQMKDFALATTAGETKETHDSLGGSLSACFLRKKKPPLNEDTKAMLQRFHVDTVVCSRLAQMGGYCSIHKIMWVHKYKAKELAEFDQKLFGVNLPQERLKFHNCVTYLAAVTQKGDALQFYASNELKNDKEIVTAAKARND